MKAHNHETDANTYQVILEMMSNKGDIGTPKNQSTHNSNAYVLYSESSALL
jgi:hypothetical protein